MSTVWKWLADETWTFKGHVVCEDLLNDIEADLAGRGLGGVFTSQVRKDPIMLDLPGMMMASRKMRQVDLDGLIVQIPSQDWRNIMNKIQLAEGRSEGSMASTHYKIHAEVFCLVLTPAQRQSMLEQMWHQALDAEEEGAEDDARFAQAIREVNEKIGYKAIVSERAEAFDAGEAGKKGSN